MIRSLLAGLICSLSLSLCADASTLLATLTASDGQPYDAFGFSAATAGNTIVVGAVGPDRSGVYVFVKPPNGWHNMTQTAKLAFSDGASEAQGYSVAISGDVVAVGAPGAVIDGRGQGAVYIFVKPAGGWTGMTETAKLTASDGQQADNLGFSLNLQENTLVAGTSAGKTYVFVRPKNGWADGTQTGEDASGGGWSVGISHGVAVSGTRGLRTIYLFQKPASGWKDMALTARLTASDSPASFAGEGVGIDGDTVVGDALVKLQNGVGISYVFVRPADGWKDMTETARLTAANQPGKGFVGPRIKGSQIGTSSDAGPSSIYIYDKPASGWQTTSSYNHRIRETGGGTGDSFGLAVLGAKILVAGSPHLGNGVAYVYKKPN